LLFKSLSRFVIIIDEFVIIGELLITTVVWVKVLREAGRRGAGTTLLWNSGSVVRHRQRVSDGFAELFRETM
jgi:hypothetical protein